MIYLISVSHETARLDEIKYVQEWTKASELYVVGSVIQLTRNLYEAKAFNGWDVWGELNIYYNRYHPDLIIRKVKLFDIDELVNL